MAEEKIIERLLDFGFTKEEAKVYLFLFRTGPSPAGLVSSRLRVNRTRAYRILRALEEKGLVEIAMGRPAKFMVAASLKEALERQIEEVKAKASGLEKSEEDIMENLEKLGSAEVLVEEPKFRILQGRQNVHDLLLQMFERVKVGICLLTTLNDLYRLSLAEIDGKLENLSHKGVKTRVLTQVDQPGLKAVNDYSSFADVHHINLPTVVRLVIIDESEALTTFAMDDSMNMTTGSDVGLWTNASSYLNTMKVLFDTLWNNNIPAQIVLQELTVQHMLIEGLNLAKKSLEANGWVVETPGKLVGESGIEHTFSLVAKKLDRLDEPLVLDLLAEGKALHQVLALRAKVTDTKPATQLLAVTELLKEKESKLIDLYNIKVIYAKDAKQLTEKIVEEAIKNKRGLDPPP